MTAREQLRAAAAGFGPSLARQMATGLAWRAVAWPRLAVLGFLAAAAATVCQPAAHAQGIGPAMFGQMPGDENAQMLLEADNLVYNEDANTVSAVGNVRILYRDYTLVAQRVTYSRASGRVIAMGNVEIIEPNGSHVFAEEIDITDNFSDGFVSSLHMETADNTRFAAESAERRDGEIAVFHNGVYTACEPCKEHPEKPPLWQIRANKVTIDNRTRTVHYEGASFELYGHPIAYVPRFSHADPTIKRKTGFLVPRVSYTETLGLGVTNTFFWAMAPNYDLSFAGTYHTNQGFLSEVEWRHRTHNGQYNLRIAGIDQKNPNDFNANTIDAGEHDRRAVMTTGLFELSPRWHFGWNALWQTDENFARTYNLNGFNGNNITNEVFLTGLAGKNYFDLRAQQFLIQQNGVDQNMYYSSLVPRPGNQKQQEQQGTALPVFDLNRVSDYPVWGGEVSLDVNARHIKRHDWQVANYDALVGKAANERFHGIAGSNTRATIEAEWKRSEIVNGAVVTASLSAQADAIFQNTEYLNTVANPLTDNDTLWRAMPAGMLEIRYPLVAHDGYATHLFEPIAQVIVRPNETNIGEFPNEDAQSLVFDTTNLFERNKFSGFDRVEGGSRANVGFRYSASYLNGASINFAAGQSYQLHGRNSFAEVDLVNAGLDSGLETTRSDYVASATLNTGHGFSLGIGGRLDERTLALRRGELLARYSNLRYAVSGSYAYIDPQPLYGSNAARHEVSGAGSVRLGDYWRAFGSFSMDLQNNSLYARGIGLAYDDSCFSFSVAYNQSEDRYTGRASDTSLLFRIGLRTIGDYSYSYSLDDAQ